MATVIAFCNQKGGTAKTTSCTASAVYLAALGKRVLVVDIDPQANATSGFGIDPNAVARHVYHGLLDPLLGDAAVMPTRLQNLHIVPSGADLAGATVELVSMERREYRLRDFLSRLRRRYDFILIDPPPSLDLLTINALTAADGIIIPVQCEYYALEGLAKLVRTINLVNSKLKTKVRISGALLTMFDRKSRLHRAVAKEVRKNFSGHVFATEITRNVSLAEAPSHGKTILEYDPYSHGAKAYRKLAQEILKLEH